MAMAHIIFIITSNFISLNGFQYDSVYNEDEISYTYFFEDHSIISRLVVDNLGSFQVLMWNNGDLQWKELWSIPKYRCDNYGWCGAYGKCGPESTDMFECTCLLGYEPKGPFGRGV